MTVLEMQEKRNKVCKRLYELRDKSADAEQEFTAEDDTNWDAVNTEYDALTRQIDRAERAEKVEARQLLVKDLTDRQDHENLATGQPTSEDRDLAITGWARSQCGIELGQRFNEAMQRCGVRVGQKELVISLPGTRDMRNLHRELRATDFQSTVSGFGGTTIPEGFVNNFESALLHFGGVRNVAEIMRTESGNDLQWPTDNDTANQGELIGETTDSDDTGATTQSIPTSVMTLQAWLYSSKIIRVSTSLLQDSAFDLSSHFGEKAGERIGRISNLHYTTGDASSKPNGIVTATTTGIESLAAEAIDEDDIINLIHSVDKAYRDQPGSGFMFNDLILKAIRKIRDTNGQFLWFDALKGGIPTMLAGYPYQVNNDMASTITAGDITILFGALRKYKVRQVREVRLKRLVERYAEFDQEAFLAFNRSDGDLLNAGTNPIKKLTQTGGGS